MLLVRIANEAFRAGDYRKALELYLDVIEREKTLARMFAANLILAKKRGGIPQRRSNDLLDFGAGPPKHLTYESAFDPAWYLKNNPDILSSPLTPLEHYQGWGWKEGRWPNSWFDPNFYVQKYPDVTSTGLEPLKHYVEIGCAESRETKASGRRRKIPGDLPRVRFSDAEEGFVALETYPPLDCALKCIAFYLPQFHPFPENDRWWGKGFTEWTNVTKAKPNYEGHYQPHLPVHLGFYDLRLPEVLKEQAELARNYGITGFNFYYYWFDGKVLMHRPFEILLENPTIDINYCLTWANENWTRKWDGADNDILISQNHSEADSLAFIKNILKFFKDQRYITVNKKPVLMVYRPNEIPDIEKTLELWRREVKKAGFPDLYIMAAQTFGLKDPSNMGFDAAVEFPPHTSKSERINDELTVKNKSYRGNIYSYEQVVENICREHVVEYKRLRTVMLSWDNTARKQDASHIFHGFTVTLYKQWLDHVCSETFTNPNLTPDEKLVFINAWNEWAEGTHLEPDRLRGFGPLAATRDVLRNYDATLASTLLSPAVKKSQFAVIIHAHYLDLWASYRETWKTLTDIGIDTYLTVTRLNPAIYQNVRKSLPQAHIRLVENRGRDILPFINVFKEISTFGYDAVCKIHLKKSAYRHDGSEIRDRLIHTLIGNRANVAKRAQDFINNPRLGLTLEASSAIKHSTKNMYYNHENTSELVNLMKIKFKPSIFPAGSMFWFKPEAMRGLEVIESNLFDIERGLSDGTVAHAVERLFCAICESNGFEISLVNTREPKKSLG